MKKILKILAGIVIGALIGLVVIVMIIMLIDSDFEPQELLSIKDIAWLKILSSVLIATASMCVAAVTHIILHETGHLIGGFATGYRFFSIRFWKFAIVNDSHGLHVKRYELIGTLGQCLMYLPENTGKTPYFWYNAGGVAANMLLCGMSLLTLTSIELSTLAESLLIMLVYTGFFVILINGLPLPSLLNDARNIVLLHQKEENRRLFANMMLCACETGKGTRPKALPERWLCGTMPQSHKELFQINSYLVYLTWLEDNGRYDEAREGYERLTETFGDKLPMIFRTDMAAEHLICELFTNARKDRIETLWTENNEKYIRQNAKYSPIKLAALFAYELLHQDNTEEPKILRKELESRQESYIMRGETLMAASIMRQAESIYESRKAETKATAKEAEAPEKEQRP